MDGWVYRVTMLKVLSERETCELSILSVKLFSP